MFASEQQIILQKTHPRSLEAIIPAVAGCIMLCASVLPWLYDPIQGYSSAWMLAVDIGWQFHTSILSYGLLCTCCAVLAFYTASVHLMRKRDIYGTPGYVSLGIMCMVPFLLFLLQYLWADVRGIEALAQHTTQALLVERHLGYSFSGYLVPLAPLKFSTRTFQEHFLLLLDLIAFGLFVPLVSSVLLIGSRRVLSAPCTVTKQAPRPIWRTLKVLGLLLLVVMFGRSPAAMMCEAAAKGSLAVGDNLTALRWLDTALILNPALDQTSHFHIYRGQADYSLDPQVQTDDSRIYLAYVYRQQADYLDAEQEIVALWYAHPTTAWVADEASVTLTTLAEYTPKGRTLIQRSENDIAAMSWLQLLSQVDSSNVYSHYVIGRFQYYLQNYNICMTQMNQVIQLTHSPDIQSSAYTYIGLSVSKEGNIADARKIFFQAVHLDPYYRNNTVREELSGLH